MKYLKKNNVVFADDRMYDAVQAYDAVEQLLRTNGSDYAEYMSKECANGANVYSYGYKIRDLDDPLYRKYASEDEIFVDFSIDVLPEDLAMSLFNDPEIARKIGKKYPKAITWIKILLIRPDGSCTLYLVFNITEDCIRGLDSKIMLPAMVEGEYDDKYTESLEASIRSYVSRMNTSYRWNLNSVFGRGFSYPATTGDILDDIDTAVDITEEQISFEYPVNIDYKVTQWGDDDDFELSLRYTFNEGGYVENRVESSKLVSRYSKMGLKGICQVLLNALGGAPNFRQNRKYKEFSSNGDEYSWASVEN